jgi:hypothetical protein
LTLAMNDFAELPKGRLGHGILGSRRGHGDRQGPGGPVALPAGRAVEGDDGDD